ncbi:MAG TPA: DUF1540 domain-containing protein [Paenibacillus sp.]|nr:DUF1540 domain-containing protein [Paenibacillus sp.]HUC93168.1 DUF1540 domain-containing protein [Paenibacillus sp.]
MPEGVKCSVSNCTYWGEGNKCVANSIMIDIDKHASADYSSEFAEGLGTDHRDTAKNASVTCCHTFEQKKE